MDYQSALNYLYGLTDYEKERIARYDPDTLDLARVKRVLARLENPHQCFPSIHIAGTKGKGSVAVTCATILKTAGLRTGLYTSPHLHTFRERIRINEELISELTLARLVQQCRPVFDMEPELTTFEAITALAFAYYAQQEVDFAVIEVGLGGRLDATNVITPRVSIITSLSLDHTYLLGNTVADIAREKAGIIKPGRPTVCAPQEAEALSVIQGICEERDAPLTLIGRDWTWRLPGSQESTSLTERGSPSLEGQSFVLEYTQGESPLEGEYTVPLLGRHQLNNAAVAIAVIDLLRRDGAPVAPDQVRQGVSDVRWPGRFELLRKDPPLVVDCAHNGDSAVKLVAALDEWFPDGNWTFILGISTDKDLTGILRAIAPRVGRLVTTEARHPRAMPAGEVASLAAEILPQAGAPHAEIEVTHNLADALLAALDGGRLTGEIPDPSPEGRSAEPICVTGSIFVVADLREVWALSTGQDLPEADDPISRDLFLAAKC